MSIKNISGKQFGRLTVVSFARKTTTGSYMWNCICECGNAKQVASGALTSGNTKSCGCYHREKILLCKSNLKHGDSYTKEYATWTRILARCQNPNFPCYNHYGQRGITVCERWRNSYENFLQDMGRAPSKGHSIDRIDVNGNYEPSNCRWATNKEQGNNKRTSRYISFKGTKKTLSEWGEFLGLYPTSIARSLKRGKSFEEIVNRKKIAQL